ncbi:MAG: Ig-like domain-containing protein [Mobilitalea sp.]
MKRIASLLLIFALCFMVVPNTASAAVKISKQKVTVEIGKTTTLDIKGTSKAAKWSSNNKKIAKVTSAGKVTGVSIGEATITATVSKKKYTCKVTVNNGFNANTAAKNIAGEFTDLGNEVVAILTNNNKYPISLSVTAVFYDADGAMLGKSSFDNYYFESKKKCSMAFNAPYDSDYKDVPYSSYKISYSISDISYTKSNFADIAMESNIGVDNVMVSVVNNGAAKSASTQLSIVFYKEGKVVGYDYQYADVEEAKAEDFIEFSFPYDENYDSIAVDDYEVFINSSYYYTW